MNAEGVTAATGVAKEAGGAAYALYQDSTFRETRQLKKVLRAAFDGPTAKDYDDAVKAVCEELEGYVTNPSLTVLSAARPLDDKSGLARRVRDGFRACVARNVGGEDPAETPSVQNGASTAPGATPPDPAEVAPESSQLTVFEAGFAANIVSKLIDALQIHRKVSKLAKRLDAWETVAEELQQYEHLTVHRENPEWILGVVRRFSAGITDNKVLRTSYAARIAAINEASVGAVRAADDGRIRQAQARLWESASSALLWTSRALAVAIVAAVTLVGLDVANFEVLDWIVDRIED